MSQLSDLGVMSVFLPILRHKAEQHPVKKRKKKHKKKVKKKSKKKLKKKKA